MDVRTLEKNLKRLIIIIAVLSFLFIVFIGNLAKRHADKMATPAGQDEWAQSMANNRVSRIKYIKDPRTNLCFAYVGKEGYVDDGVTCVPCEAIPPELLKVAELPK